ncbi:MAG: FAD:protein FMN transferase [Clostridia bacterium]|nr:FAD:protein FMN transferase [Clostridia bacterium]
MISSFLVCCLLLVLLAPCESRAEEAERVSGVGYYFDTVVTITLYGTDEKELSSLLEDIWVECARYEHLLSKTIPGSDVSRLNEAHGEAIRVDPETWDILRRAKDISASSGHAFSVTIAPVTELWDFTGGTQRMPDDDELAAALPLVDDEALELLGDSMVRLPDGMKVDLGGIAKGYIADRVADLCRDQVIGATLNFGGNVYAVGEKPGSAPFRVGIRDPQGGENSSIAVVSVKDISVVTSGIYERFFVKDGVSYHHILDPESGISAFTDLAGATIICTSSMDADAMATACIVMGREKALAYLQENGMDGLLIDRDNEIYTTPGFEDTFALQLLFAAP